MKEILEKTGLTEQELWAILNHFGSSTMSAALRQMYKCPSNFYWEEDEEDYFSPYDLYEISNKMNNLIYPENYKK